MTNLDNLLQKLSEAPPDPNGPQNSHAQIDESQTPRLKALIGKTPKEQAEGLKAILDDCAYGSLASGVAMFVMDKVWKMAKEEAGM